MRGIVFACLGGAFLTLQGVANARISQDIGTWQTAAITQLTGFVSALLILLFVRDGKWQGFTQVKPLYLTGGTLAAVIIFSNVTAIQSVGVTLAVSALLIAQLSLTFVIDSNGWFGVTKQKMRLPQFIGIGMMIAGVSLQNIFNSKVNERAGAWATTAFVLGMGFLSSLTIGLIMEGKRLLVLQHMQPWYWLSGLIGVGVVSCLVQAMRLLGPTYAISVVLTSQLGFALLWDSLGWFGLDKVPFTFKQLLGVLVIVGGILAFKLGGRQETRGSSKLSA
ncbi:DMT family transporter [Brevibacillus borstelensis]|uniref:DMT family transporter n=1 Tax=Brevibacillus borstelensis TaxID=45462 RepID=UPI0030BEA7A9